MKLALMLPIMRGFDSELGLMGAGILFAFMILLLQPALAFPLHGSNGEVNTTIYGIMKYEYGDGLYVDISASDTDVYEAEMIDKDNNTYSGNNAPYRDTFHGFPTETAYDGSIRDMILFDVPKDAIISRLRIVPSYSKPFYINWTSPEIVVQNATLEFYGADYEPNGIRWRQGNWNLDVNITNSRNQTSGYNASDFALVDQFGWVYPGEKGDALRKIPSGESMRFIVKVPFVSEISRPKAILFKGVNMDISAWA
ncbi:Uncharacterised protein [uncultured archaeon]|nr:Uncharacterised protein [uncultured archaeon]